VAALSRQCFPGGPFFLHCFCWNRSLPPLRGQPTGKCYPRWQPIQGLAIHCRLGRLLDSNPGLQYHNLVSLPMSHHCSQGALSWQS
jgi:hypothetical protein